jgi:hypothetical protein
MNSERFGLNSGTKKTRTGAKYEMKSKGLVLGFLFALSCASSHAVEMVGFAGYASSLYASKPTAVSKTAGGIGYGFLTRFDLGAGMIEGGFLYAPTSLTWSVGGNDVTASGSYWILPIQYHLPIYLPYLSISIGPDFAIMGNTSYSYPGSTLPSAEKFKSHFGAEVSVQASQDLGENLSAVIDLRYREGIGSAFTINNQSTRLNFFMTSFGIQKRLE